MPLKYAYHPGNVAHSSAPEVAETVVPAAKSLGIDLIPMDGATSCGGGIIRQANRRLQLTQCPYVRHCRRTGFGNCHSVCYNCWYSV